MSTSPPKSTKNAVRNAERRRTATCRFADRVAKVSVEHYRKYVPKEHQGRTCMATIVAHFSEGGRLLVLGMGVGTKFLPDQTLKEEAASPAYGGRVRDSHAEVLARRAFRRQIMLEIKGHQQENADSESLGSGILKIVTPVPGVHKQYALRDGVTLHMYTSSAPCGNATLKKFATMKKEKFLDQYGPDEWPRTAHETIQAHSIRLGQFALLIKKDTTAASQESADHGHKRPSACLDDANDASPKQVSKGKVWPAMVSDDWCPPGTSTVSLQKGSLHTCSDKICLWNYLGLQGSLLAGILVDPLYLSTITVGRKFTECICRRAVCCRLDQEVKKKKGKNKEAAETDILRQYHSNHPAIMGTAVYLDEGTVETSSNSVGQDVRFHDSHCWAWWPHLEVEDEMGSIECINGATGYLMESKSAEMHSRISTRQLVKLFADIGSLQETKLEEVNKQLSLCGLRDLKSSRSPSYQLAKKQLERHQIFRDWVRRYVDEEGRRLALN